MARVWFITGCSKGLGLSIAEAALEDGDSVVATARRPQTLDPLVQKYGTNRVLPLALDVCDNDQVQSVLQTSVEKFGRLDVVVNNAGYADVESLEDGTIESFRAQIDTNLMGVVNVTKAVIPIFRKQGDGGRILQVSSVGGRLATPGLSAYQAAKWAVGGFSGVVQKEVEPFGIKLTVFEPGAINTDWAASGADTKKISAGYVQSVGAFNDMRQKFHEVASEPATLAKTILQISKVADPPLRLLLGEDIIQFAKEAAKALAESDEKWEAATRFSL